MCCVCSRRVLYCGKCHANEWIYANASVELLNAGRFQEPCLSWLFRLHVGALVYKQYILWMRSAKMDLYGRGGALIDLGTRRIQVSQCDIYSRRGTTVGFCNSKCLALGWIMMFPGQEEMGYWDGEKCPASRSMSDSHLRRLTGVIAWRCWRCYPLWGRWKALPVLDHWDRCWT